MERKENFTVKRISDLNRALQLICKECSTVPLLQTVSSDADALYNKIKTLVPVSSLFVPYFSLFIPSLFFLDPFDRKFVETQDN